MTVLHVTPIDRNVIKEIQQELDESLFGEYAWTKQEIARRESLRVKLACARDGRHYGEFR